MQIEPIAHIHTDFPTKFGVPRQSGLASELTSKKAATTAASAISSA